MPRRPSRTQQAFRDEFPQLLRQQGISQRELARRIGVNASYLTFVRQGDRRPSRALLEGAAKALGLQPDYFREYRELVVVEQIKRDTNLLDRVYSLVNRAKR